MREEAPDRRHWSVSHGDLLSSAQTSNGVIRGSVHDVTGAVLVDALVSLRNEATNQSWKQITNAEGFFEFRALLFGNYNVEVEHPRFRKEGNPEYRGVRSREFNSDGLRLNQHY